MFPSLAGRYRICLLLRISTPPPPAPLLFHAKENRGSHKDDVMMFTAVVAMAVISIDRRWAAGLSRWSREGDGALFLQSVAPLPSRHALPAWFTLSPRPLLRNGYVCARLRVVV